MEAKTRPATDADFEFAWGLYASCVRPLMEPHIVDIIGKSGWDDNTEKSLFRGIWSPPKVLIIEMEAKPIGWVAIDKSENVVRIENFYILEQYRNHGLGTTLLNWLIGQNAGRPFVTSVITGCRSESLFRRLNFKELSRLGFEIQLARAA